MRKIQCEICGSTEIKKIADDLFECVSCGSQYSTAEVRKLLVEDPKNESSSGGYSQVLSNSKYCSKCGKPVHVDAVICVNCGCSLNPNYAISQNAAPNEMEPTIDTFDYEVAIQSSSTCNIIGIILLIVGVLLRIFINSFFVAFACLAAEIVFLIPNTKVQSITKRHFAHVADKAERKAKVQAVRIALKARNPAYKLSFILSYVALLGVIILAALV